MIAIVGPPLVSYTSVHENVPSQATSWYDAALVALWIAGITTGVDPIVLAAQCAHETGWGNFGGAVTPDMGNTCGLKNQLGRGDAKADHATFPMKNGFPITGAFAHAHHLMLYSGFPVPDNTPDPRAMWVGPGTVHFGSARYVEELSGKWAPSKDYGKMVVLKYIQLLGRSPNL